MNQGVLVGWAQDFVVLHSQGWWYVNEEAVARREINCCPDFQRGVRELCRCRVLTSVEVSDGGLVNVEHESGCIMRRIIGIRDVKGLSVALAWGSEGVPPSGLGVS